jgi:hypothetical protein
VPDCDAGVDGARSQIKRMLELADLAVRTDALYDGRTGEKSNVR